jgi:two-component system, NarL family, nitrate/nitrite response regulator NarL
VLHSETRVRSPRRDSGRPGRYVDMEMDQSTFLRAVRAGVVGYVLKDASAVGVGATISAVAEGAAVCPPALSMALFRYVAQHRKSSGDSCRMLSRREHELMALLRERLTNKEIAARLNLSEQTVKNHVHRMLRKVGAPDRFAVVERYELEGLDQGAA